MRTIIVIAILFAAALTTLGYLRNWFDFSAQSSSQDESKLTLSVEVDKEKIKSDTEAARQKAKEVGESVKTKLQAQPEGTTASGEVAMVEGVDDSFVVTTADMTPLTIHVEPFSQLRLKEDELKLQDIQVGDHVTVVYHVREGKNIAQLVTVERA